MGFEFGLIGKHSTPYITGLTVGIRLPALLGGSWVVLSRVISRVTILTTHIRVLVTHL